MEAITEKPNLRPTEASDYLERQWGISRKPSTLAKMRCISSDGPAFLKARRGVLYPREALDQYARRILSGLRHSTSEAA